MKPSVMVGIATGPYVVTQFSLSLAGLLVYKSDKYDCRGIISYQGVLIDSSRNKIVNDFMATDSDWLMMLDTDVVFRATLIDELLEMHEIMGTRVGSGWYNMIMNPNSGIKKPAISNISADGKVSTSPIITLETTPVYFPADVGPSGAMLIHREVFEKIRETGEKFYFKFTHTDKDTLTEDIHFCELVKRAGYQFMVARDVQMPHYKLLPI